MMMLGMMDGKNKRQRTHRGRLDDVKARCGKDTLQELKIEEDRNIWGDKVRHSRNTYR